MAVGPVALRTTTLMLSNNLQSSLSKTQLDLFETQKQITTGKKYEKPSEGASKTSAILLLRQSLAAREQWDLNLEFAHGVLNNADQALGDATDVLLEATSIASSQVGVGSDAETRAIQARVIDAQIDSLTTIANRQYNDLSLFGGDDGATGSSAVFVSFLGGIRYVGGDDNLGADVGRVRSQTFNSNGTDAFGALSSRVKTHVDLDVQASTGTRISEIDGAQNFGYRAGQVVLTVDGTQVNVDLTTIDTLGDVITRINDAINNIDATAGSLAISGEGFALTANAGHTISIAEFGQGETAGDLGIDLSATSTTTAGVSVGRRLSVMTDLADLATTVDWTSGLTITQGNQTKTADFSSATNIQDVINVIDGLGLGLRMSVNADETGLDLISEVSGLRLSVGENTGTTAQDLGLHTLGPATKLSEFREGLGVETQTGENDFRVSLHDGTTFDVDVTGIATVGDLVTAINAAATTAGLTVGTDFSVDYKSVGNGLVFTDNTAGASDFKIENLGLSLAADHLGILGNATTGSTITGSDNAKVFVDSIFTHLSDLSAGLKNNDPLGITLAGEKVEAGIDKIVQARAIVGIESNRVTLQRERSKDLEITEKQMLSEIQDVDMTEAITKFSLLQTQLQASLQVGAQNLQLSLLDFLR